MNDYRAGAVLMTGATGFLGSSLLKRLAAKGLDLVILTRKTSDLRRIAAYSSRFDNRLLEETDLDRLFRKKKIRTLIHCATNYGLRATPPVSVLEANLLLPLRLLEIGRRNGLSLFLNTDTILDKRINYYSLSKSQFREWLKLYSDMIACANVSLEHFYGPGDDASKFVTQMITSMIARTKEIRLSPGQQKRDFIYIDDVVEALLRVLNGTKTGKPGFYHYEIGTGRTISIRKFVLMIKDLLGNNETFLNFGALPYRENEVMESKVDLSAIRALGWTPKVTLEKGLARTIALENGRPAA